MLILTKEIKQAMKFYKMPRALFESKEYQNLSIKAKTMYMLLFDRLDLSVKNGWTDEQGYTYQYYTIEQFMIDLGCSNVLELCCFEWSQNHSRLFLRLLCVLELCCFEWSQNKNHVQLVCEPVLELCCFEWSQNLAHPA